jgi:hypothetical protein
LNGPSPLAPGLAEIGGALRSKLTDQIVYASRQLPQLPARRAEPPAGFVARPLYGAADGVQSSSQRLPLVLQFGDELRQDIQFANRTEGSIHVSQSTAEVFRRLMVGDGDRHDFSKPARCDARPVDRFDVAVPNTGQLVRQRVEALAKNL